MKRRSLFLGLFALLAIASLSSTPAHAQVLRTYVSAASGADSGSCSRSAPCLTFAFAQGFTLPGGEIICLDSGNFGTITIVKSLTIDCAATRAHINITVDTGITVSADASSKVIIRNLHLTGSRGGGGENGYDGIRYLTGGELEVENIFIAGVSPAYAGINVVKSTLGVLSVRNSTFSRMAVGIKLAASAQNIVASVTNTSFNNLTNTAIDVGANSYVGVSNSVFSAVYGYGINSATSSSTVYAIDNVFTNNNVGISATVAGAKINASNNKFFGNGKAFNVASGATFLSGQANLIDINPGNPPTGALTYR